jgi:hypothetical protein
VNIVDPETNRTLTIEVSALARWNVRTQSNLWIATDNRDKIILVLFSALDDGTPVILNTKVVQSDIRSIDVCSYAINTRIDTGYVICSTVGRTTIKEIALWGQNNRTLPVLELMKRATAVGSFRAEIGSKTFLYFAISNGVIMKVLYEKHNGVAQLNIYGGAMVPYAWTQNNVQIWDITGNILDGTSFICELVNWLF